MLLQLYEAPRSVIYGAAYATEIFFSLVFFSHYNDFWYLTLHFTQTKKYASTYLRIQIFMNELNPFENLSKSWGKRGKKDQPVLLNRIPRYMVIQERSKKVSVWPPNCVLYIYKFVRILVTFSHSNALKSDYTEYHFIRNGEEILSFSFIFSYMRQIQNFRITIKCCFKKIVPYFL